LDTHNGKAYVSAVAFTMTNLRPRAGGRLTAVCAKPVGRHEFLNVRTYVRHGNERGICFLAEWLPNRLSIFFAPKIYGLPYRLGLAEYQHRPESGTWCGVMTASDGKRFSYHATPENAGKPSIATEGSLDEFLLERYAAFTERRGARRLFRVWHEPWQFIRLRLEIDDDSLLASTGEWFRHASYVGAHYCFDAHDVWMSQPRKIAASKVGSPTAHPLTQCPTSQPRANPFDWLPVLLMTFGAVAIQQWLPAWAFMWTLAATMFFGLKWLTLRHALRRGLTACLWRKLSYLFLWIGMNAKEFLSTGRTESKSRPVEWGIAFAKTALGVALLWAIVPLLSPSRPLLVGWTGMAGLIFLMHFGAFHLLSLVWRSAGFAAPAIMRNPVGATSLSDFWSDRWNLAFRDAAHVLVFRPLRARLGASGAMFVVFLASGLIHDFVISLPAGGGFGLPTMYFVVQGAGVWFERSFLGKKLGLQNGIRARVFALTIVAAPVFWLFHPMFVERVMLPFLQAVGAMKGTL
jgi:alginate O-acetyltransferase complex protein AlgI